jgi:hypothetical protein
LLRGPVLESLPEQAMVPMSAVAATTPANPLRMVRRVPWIAAKLMRVMLVPRDVD